MNDDVFQIIHDIILMMFGYRLIESYKFATNENEKRIAKDSLQSIYDIQIMLDNKLC